MNSAKRIALEASNNNKDWVLLGNYTNTNNVANGVWTVDIPESVQGWFRYYRYKITDRNVTNDSYVTIGFITITADWLSPDIIEIPLYTQQTDEEVAGRAAPIVMDGQTLYAAYGYTDNEFASTIRCKVPGAAYNEGSPTVLLLQQVKEGSMNFGKPGNGSVYTFTVPSGVKVVKITWTQSYDEGSYNRIINTANSKEWWRNDSSGSKTLYVGVTAHKTYVMKNTWGDGSISGMVWSYSKDINAIAPSVTDY